jgi:Family of unknown function (DUF6941)
MMLCDHAQVADGKMFISGGGWSITGTPTPPSAVAVLLQVPWTEANRRVTFRLKLVDGDGRPVGQRDVTGQVATVEVNGELTARRPTGLPEGTLLDAPLAVTFAPLDLAPGRYVWELWIDGENHEDWQVSFLARATGNPGSPG